MEHFLVVLRYELEDSYYGRGSDILGAVTAESRQDAEAKLGIAELNEKLTDDKLDCHLREPWLQLQLVEEIDKDQLAQSIKENFVG